MVAIRETCFFGSRWCSSSIYPKQEQTGHVNQLTRPFGFNSTQQTYEQPETHLKQHLHEERPSVNKTTRAKRDFIHLEMLLVLIRRLSAAWDRTTGAHVWAWLVPAVIKSGYGPRRPTTETQFHIEVCTFNMTYALLLSLFFHLFHPPHTSTSKHSVYIRKGEISPFTLVYWAQQIIFLVYMRSAGTGDCWIDVLLFGLRLVLRGQVARHRSHSCGPLCYRSVHLPAWAFPTHTDSLPAALSPSWSLTFPFCACYISHQGAFKRERTST